MARHFTRANSDKVRVDIGAASGEVAGPCTIVAVVRRASNSAGGIHSWFSMNTSAGNNTPLELMFYTADQLAWSTPIVDRTSTFTVVAADGWVLVAINKATGTVTPRMHKYAYGTNTWTHQAASGTSANPAAPGVGGWWEIGLASQFPSDQFDGDIAAVCYIPRVLTDSEIEQMAAGNWWRYSPRFHREFKSGEDQIAKGRQIGRDATYDITLAGTSRAAVSDPPGFRFSPSTPRR